MQDTKLLPKLYLTPSKILKDLLPMCEQKTNEISFSFKDGILKHTSPAVDPCVGNLEKNKNG